MALPNSFPILQAALLATLMSANALAAADKDAGAPAQEDEEAATPAPLPIGSMAIASDTALAVEAMTVDVAVDRVAYAYKLHNKGKDRLTLAASVALPDLEVNSEGNTFYDLPSKTAENPIDLKVEAAGQPVATTAYVQAVALGVDRLADLKAAGLPLIPFGAEIDKALAAAKPEALAKLESLGLVTPHDPAQPDTPVIADWSLRIVHGWTQPIDAGATANVVVSFTPVKAVYKVDATSLAGFSALKEQVCLTPQVLAAAKNLLKSKGAIAEVADITLANDGPARWLDNPAATVAVRKPKPNAVVAFCGIDAGAEGKAVVTGKMPGSNEAAGLRILIFSPA